MRRSYDSIKGAASQFSIPASKCFFLASAAASFGLLVTPMAFSQETVVAEDDAQTSAEELSASTSAESLRIDPLFRVGVTTESGGTPTTLNAFDGFFPLLQTPGNSVTYLNTRLNLDFVSSSTLSGTLTFGHRSYSSEQERILGGYVAIDARDTTKATFPQVGFGFERLGKWWDIRANGYVPVGDTRQRVDRDVFTSSENSTSIGDPAFTGNILARTISTTTTDVRTQVDRYEAALGGFDVEAGTRLARWQEHGELRLYGGIYYLGGNDVSEIGGRGRIEIVPVDRIRLIGGVQGDNLFNIRGFFGASYLFPTPEALRNDVDLDERAEAIATLGETVTRLADPIARNFSVVVDGQEDVETSVTRTTTSEDVPFINPATGDPWRFTHVALGGNSDSTFEDPFALLQDGLDATVGDGNDIVYVALADDTAVDPFTIPDNVQVLSTGPEQVIETLFEGSPELVMLPGSNDGNFPDVTDTVVLGNNSTLSGFDITGSTGAAIVGPDGLNGSVRVSDNRLSSSVGNGVQVGEINDALDLVISFNTIDDVAANGIAFASDAVSPVSLTTNANAFITIGDNTISNAAETGILVADIQGDAVVDLAIGSNIIENSGVQAIGFGLFEGDTEIDIAISQNTLTSSLSSPMEDGISFLNFEDNSDATITIASNTISNTSDAGLEFVDFLDNATADIVLAGNTILNTFEGIEFDDFQGDSKVDISIAQNSISNSETDAIELDDFEDNTEANIAIHDNRITNSGINAINIDNIRDSAKFTLDIVENQIDSIENVAIFIDSIQGEADATVNITDNTITNIENDGINVDVLGQATLDLTIDGNRIENTISPPNPSDIQAADINNNSENTTIFANGNILSNNGSTGFEFINQPAGKLCLMLDSNTGNNVSVADFTLTNNATPADFEVIDLNTITLRNTGRFNPPNISTNTAFTNVSSCN